MYSTVTDDFIISTISDYQGEVILIEKKIETIRKSFAEDESLIYAASIPGINGREDVPASPFERDLQTVYERYQKLKKIRTEDGIEYITELFEKKDSMDRVMAAYKVIPKNWRSVWSLILKKRDCDATLLKRRAAMITPRPIPLRRTLPSPCQQLLPDKGGNLLRGDGERKGKLVVDQLFRPLQGVFIRRTQAFFLL